MVAPSGDVPLLLVEQLFVILVCAHALGRLTERLGLTAVVGELATGFVLGPSGLGILFPAVAAGLFPDPTSQLLEGIASVGLILLLVLAGLEVDLSLVRTHARTTAIVGVLGTVVPFVLGFLFARWLPPTLRGPVGSPVVFAAFVATALSVSAIPVVIRILYDIDGFRTELGQILVAAAVLTDLFAWFALGVITQIVRVGQVTPWGVLRGVGLLVLFFGGAALLGRRLVAAGMPHLDSIGSPNRQVGAVVTASLGAGALALTVGLEAFLGAFVLGTLIASVGGLPGAVRDRFEALTLGVFAPLFFGVAGLRADLTTIGDATVLGVAAAALVVAVVGKFAGVYLGAIIAGRDGRDGFTLGAGLNARGAIEIILASIGLELGVLSVAMYTVILIVAVGTSVMAPPLLRWGFSRSATPLADA